MLESLPCLARKAIAAASEGTSHEDTHADAAQKGIHSPKLHGGGTTACKDRSCRYRYFRPKWRFAPHRSTALVSPAPARAHASLAVFAASKALDAMTDDVIHDRVFNPVRLRSRSHASRAFCGPKITTPEGDWCMTAQPTGRHGHLVLPGCGPEGLRRWPNNHPTGMEGCQEVSSFAYSLVRFFGLTASFGLESE